MSREIALDGSANQFQKAVLFFVLTQLLLELRCKEIEKFGVACDEWLRCVRGAKDNYIAWCPDDDFAAKATLDLAKIRALLNVFESERIDRRAASMSSKRTHPREAVVGEA